METITLDETHAKVLQWSKDRKIIQNGAIETQTLKLISEVGELCDNVAKKRTDLQHLGDDIGDCLVVLTNIAEMAGLSLQDCFAKAYSDIKDRKGYLNEIGVFIKEGDVE